MRCRAIFTSGSDIVDVFEFEEHWEDFLHHDYPDAVFDRKAQLEESFGSSVSIRIRPMPRLISLARPRRRDRMVGWPLAVIRRASSFFGL